MHEFTSTESAYDATQCDEKIKNGDTLVIEKEGVVGLAWTWPVAVTVAKGELHGMGPDGDVERVMTDAEWTPDQVRAAVTEAERRGFAVEEVFKRLVARQ